MVPCTVPVLIMVVIAHIMLENCSCALPALILEVCLSVATVLLFVVAPTSFYMLFMFIRVAPLLLDHLQTVLQRVNEKLSVNVKL